MLPPSRHSREHFPLRRSVLGFIGCMYPSRMVIRTTTPLRASSLIHVAFQLPSGRQGCPTVRRATLLFTIATVKDVRDHCGYSLPLVPLQRITGTNTDYHDIHHQVFTSWVISVYRVLNSALGNWDQVQLLTTVLHALGCPPWYENDETGCRGSKKAQAC